MSNLFRLSVPMALLAAASCLAASECMATGWWNLPSTANQFMGCGFGPGYHAPMVMGNAWRGKAASPGVRRVPTPLHLPRYSVGMVHHEQHYTPQHEYQVEQYQPQYRPTAPSQSMTNQPIHRQPTFAPTVPLPGAETVTPQLFEAPTLERPAAASPQTPASPSEQPAAEQLPVP
ncbi:hypothetical protein [Aeoliella sp.]|uniref:hypothetical protein n=1 Tax=Aeoliella sp. TaxID=2795800 RepID=UPI003CCBBBAE